MLNTNLVYISKVYQEMGEAAIRHKSYVTFKTVFKLSASSKQLQIHPFPE